MLKGKGRTKAQLAEEVVHPHQHVAELKAPGAAGQGGKLQDSPRFLQAVIDAIPEVTMVIDRDYRIVLANRAAQELAGGEDPVASHRTCYSVLHHRDAPCDSRESPCPLEQVIRTKALVTVEHTHLGPGGGEVFVEVTAAPILDDTGEVVRIIESCRDITEQRRAVQALRESEENARLLVESVRDYAIFMLDPDGCVASWNAGAERIKGYRREEIIGHHISRFYTSRDIQDGKPEHALQMAALEGRFEDEGLHVREDGTQFFANVVITALRDESGQLRGFSTVTRDVTERKQTAEALQKAHDELAERVKELQCLYGLASSVRERATLVEVFQDVAELIPPAWRYPEITCGRVRFDGREYVSRPFRETEWKQSSDIVVDGEARGVVEVFYLQERTQRDDGPFTKEERDIMDVLGRILGRAAERDQAKAALSKAYDELDEKVKQRTAELAVANRELAAANKELEAFAYSVSHDLRAPLRGMDGFSAALLEEYAQKLDEQGRGYLARVRAAAGRMAELIDDLLGLSRIGRVEMEYQAVDLSALAERIAADLRAAEPDRRVTFEIAGGLRADGDRSLLRITLEKLIDNAWKFTSRHEKARIDFGVTDVHNERALFIRDDGAGFDMAYVHKLFGPFQRLHSLDEFPGTGIGLATAQRIIHRHGGRIWARGEVEKGATFYFTLPQRPETDLKEATT